MLGDEISHPLERSYRPFDLYTLAKGDIQDRRQMPLINGKDIKLGSTMQLETTGNRVRSARSCGTDGNSLAEETALPQYRPIHVHRFLSVNNAITMTD